MPEHDEIPTTEADLEVLQEYPTRTSRRDAVVAGWREQMLEEVTPVWKWIALAVLYVALMVLSIALPDMRLTLSVAFLASVGAWLVYARWRRSDIHHRALSQLSPVVDRSTLIGEATILSATNDALIATLQNPSAGKAVRIEAARRVLMAAEPIMARGGVTPETATVAGYPAWPEIDRTELPGSEGDFATMPLMRVDATVKRLSQLVQADVILAESIAQIAGEVVPPLRALEDALSKES
jgi:hypothetical protein